MEDFDKHIMETRKFNNFEQAEKLAEFFHKTYEAFAPMFSYKTREASAVPWKDVPENNRNLMIVVCDHILGKKIPQLPSGKELTKLVRKYADSQCDGIPEMNDKINILMQENMRSYIKWLQEQGY